MSRKRITSIGGVTENAVFLFRYGLLLERKGERDSDRFKEVDRELSRELGLKPWHPSVFDVAISLDDEEDDGIPPSIPRDYRAHYQHAINLRRALIGAPR